MACYLTYHDDILQLHNILKKDLESLRHDKELLSIALGPILFIRPFAFTLMVVICGFTYGHIFMPTLYLIIDHVRHVENPRYLLPLPTHLPYAIVGGSFSYYMTFIFESYSVFTILGIAGGLDNAMSFYCSQIIGQFDVLSYKISNLKFSSNSNEKLQAIITKHEQLINHCRKVETIYGPCVWIMIGATSVVMCALIFQVRKVSSIGLCFFSLLIIHL